MAGISFSFGNPKENKTGPFPLCVCGETNKTGKWMNKAGLGDVWTRSSSVSIVVDLIINSSHAFSKLIQTNLLWLFGQNLPIE